MGETSKGDVRVLEDASRVWLEELILVQPCLEGDPFEKFCVTGSVALSISHTNSICTEPFGSTSISSPLLPTTSSHLHAFHAFLGDIRGYYPPLIHTVHI